MIVKPFKYKGRTVIGRTRFTANQHWKIYGLVKLYALAVVYVIVRDVICQCAYVSPNEAMLIGAITVTTFLLTAVILRIEERKNYIYEED